MIEGMQMRRTLFFVLSTFLIVSSMVRSEEPEKKNSGLRNMQTVKFQPSVLGSAQQTKETESSDRLPSKGMAFLYSLLLPGSGEYYAGSKKMAKVFFTSELLLWATYFSFRTYGHWKEDDYRRFAVAHAGINLFGKDHQYFVDIENYDNIQDYNEAKLRQRDTDAIYPEDAYYSWQWDSEAARERFEEMRVASDKAYNGSLFVIGGIVLNHIISGIDALSIARKRREEGRGQVRLGVVGLPEGGGVITLLKVF